MDQRLDRIEEKVDSLKEQLEIQRESGQMRQETLNRAAVMIMQINDKMGQHTEILAKNTADLEYHIRRTDILEKKIDSTERDIKSNTEFRNRTEWTFKLIGVCCSVAGLIFGGIKAIDVILQYF